MKTKEKTKQRRVNHKIERERNLFESENRSLVFTILQSFEAFVDTNDAAQ
jgi:hypothetical protein